jgi:hypothetical protein
MNHFDPLDIRSQEESVANAEERVRFDRLEEVEDLKWILSNKRGRRDVYRRLERAGVWQSSFSTNALTMAFQEGSRNEGLRLLSLIQTHCVDRYAEMLKEAKA